MSSRLPQHGPVMYLVVAIAMNRLLTCAVVSAMDTSNLSLSLWSSIRHARRTVTHCQSEVQASEAQAKRGLKDLHTHPSKLQVRNTLGGVAGGLLVKALDYGSKDSRFQSH